MNIERIIDEVITAEADPHELSLAKGKRNMEVFLAQQALNRGVPIEKIPNIRNVRMLEVIIATAERGKNAAGN